MKTASVAEVKARFSAFVKAAEDDGPVVVTRNGKPVVIMLPAPDDADELERLILAYSPRFQAFLEAADKRISAGHGIPYDQFRRMIQEEDRTKAKGDKSRRKSAKAS